MSGSLNEALLIGNLVRDPEMRTTQTGKRIANISVATSDTWNDKASGERKEKTEYHRVVIFNEKLAEIAEKYLRKGSKVLVRGAIQTRKWVDKDSQERYSTEVVLQNFRGELTMLDERRSNGSPSSASSGGGSAGGYQDAYAAGNSRATAGFGGKPGMRETGAAQRAPVNDLDDDIPFATCDPAAEPYLKRRVVV